MSVSRIARWAVTVAAVAAAAVAGSAGAASAAKPGDKPSEPPTGPVSRFEVPLTGQATFADLGTLTFAGKVLLAVPPNPISPQGFQIIHTRLVDGLGTGTEVSCAARGSQHFRLASASTLEFTGTYNMVPPNPIQPGDPAEACWGKRLDVEFTVNLDAAGNVVGLPTAVAVGSPEQPQP
ncbi:hypothetical protein [Catellatospora vulcania]|uniref:hypothetical protein n=1 Tax=Catellatospora vulcania TaxID=1460450 RepID=UPI0012D3948E|nr:hypothetical protein [Catellatospora vulcania]